MRKPKRQGKLTMEQCRALSSELGALLTEAEAGQPVFSSDAERRECWQANRLEVSRWYRADVTRHFNSGGEGLQPPFPLAHYQFDRGLEHCPFDEQRAASWPGWRATDDEIRAELEAADHG